MNTRTISILALGLALASGTALAGPVPTDLAVQASNARLQVALNNNVGASELQSLYTPDAVVIPPSGQIISSTADYAAYLSGYMRDRMGNFQVETVDLRTEGDLAYQSAVWMATLKGGTEVSGEMSNVLQRQADGSWKIKFQNWN